MASKIVLADTSILIDFFRTTDKANSYLVGLIRQDYMFCILAITEFEIYTEATEGQYQYWNDFLKKTQVLHLIKTLLS